MINSIIASRASGKTTRLIDISNKRNIPIITATAHMANSIKELAKYLKIDIPEPVPIAVWIKDPMNYSKPCLIDELEASLRSIGINAEWFTMSTNDI